MVDCDRFFSSTLLTLFEINTVKFEAEQEERIRGYTQTRNEGIHRRKNNESRITGVPAT